MQISDVDKILGLKKDDLVGVEVGDYDSDIYGDYEPDAEVLTPQQVIYLKLEQKKTNSFKQIMAWETGNLPTQV